MNRILVVDDDKLLCEMLMKHLSRTGFDVEATHLLGDGIQLVNDARWDIILLDVQMPDGNGLDSLPSFLNSPSQPEVIIITGQGAADGAEQAVLSGAWSYIEKPHVIRELKLHLPRALQYREEKLSTHITPVALKRRHIIGQAQVLDSCFDDLAKAAASNVNVLLTGETGTGKEVFARAIHENSPDSKSHFVVVDCASLPENLLESALFGHVKGAFTGADRAAQGLIKRADQGTLFLDEVGELPLHMQKAFLRVLQEHSFRPVGASKEETSCFRLLAATNRDIEAMVEEGSFRKDLYYRLQGIIVHLPPLRDRKEDIEDLVQFYLKKLCVRYGLDNKMVSPDFYASLMEHEWPGNVRELFQIIEHVFAGCVEASTIFSIHLPSAFRVQVARAAVQNEPDNTSKSAVETLELMPWDEYREEMEKEYVNRLMVRCQGDAKAACVFSGISKSKMYRLLKQYE
jgi:two-component system, NtrC family, response regulator